LKLLKSTIQKESELQELLTNADRNIERLASDCNLIREQLEIYANLDEESKKYNQLKNATLADYEKYYYATRLAEKIPSLESKHKEAVRQKSALESELKSTESKLSEISKNFDLIQYKQTREKADQLRLRLSAVTAAKLEKENRLDKLKSDYEEYFSITKILDQAYKNRERYEKIKETTEYFRSVLREAAPVVAQNYVYRVSAEANQIFREITANAGTMLKWREDYGIIIEEDGYERPFQSLSGGEQMAAALSIRLALLKQLTDVRIAFFDEPTTNMDAERRENLAAQLGRIRDFDQIFVISHDDTFEPYLDNEIRLD
ncbi:MAG TPA: hypothetical protein VNK26_01190, partial [Pyrinomonadaceae bacterium]|nr:hypothetical protein [Pyrinomonadaceae bacterium]